MLINELGTRLKLIRLQKGLLQKQVAAKLGITESGYGFYEQGKRTPDSEMLKKITSLYEVSADFLLGIDTPTTQSHLSDIHEVIAKEYGEELSAMFKKINDWDESKIKKLNAIIALMNDDNIL